MNTALLVFIICTVINVIVSTIKSVMTIKGGKFSAAFWNAAGYGLYSYIVVMTANANISTFAKVATTIVCNLICVYGVKWVEEKMRKDRLWKIEMTVPAHAKDFVIKELEDADIPFNYIENIGKYVIVNAYASTQAQTAVVDTIATQAGAKRFASETKFTP